MPASLPKVTLIMPAYNAAAWIGDALRSIAAQTMGDFELIVVNDGSTDSTADIVRRAVDDDDRIRLLRQTNSGVSVARNVGLAAAAGEWVGFVDADDTIAPDYLVTLLHAAESDPEIDMAACGLTYRYADGSETSEAPADGLNDLREPDGLFAVATQPLITSPVCKLYRRQRLRGLTFREGISYGEDRDFNVHFLSRCRKAAGIAKCLYNYRRDIASSLSASHGRDSLEADLDYWTTLESLFFTTGSLTPQVERYLADRLYFFITDHFALHPYDDATEGTLLRFEAAGKMRRYARRLPGFNPGRMLARRGWLKMLHFYINRRK